MSNIVNYVRPSSGGQDRNDINKILEAITDFIAPAVETEGVRERIAVTPETRVRSDLNTVGTSNFLGAELRDRENFYWRRKVPNSPDTYPLVHTTNGSGLTFPVKDTKFGGRCDFEGTSYITIADDTILEPTDEISVSAWYFLPASDGSFHWLYAKDNASATYQGLILNTMTNVLRTEVRVGGGTSLIDFTYTPNTWFHYTMTWKGSTENRFRIYIDKVQQGSDVTTVGTLNQSNDPLGIGARPNGTLISQATTRMAHLSLLHDEVNQTWIDNHFDAFMNTDHTDTDGFKEITTIPFVGDETPLPDAYAGLCST